MSEEAINPTPEQIAAERARIEAMSDEEKKEILEAIRGRIGNEAVQQMGMLQEAYRVATLEQMTDENMVPGIQDDITWVFCAKSYADFSKSELYANVKGDEQKVFMLGMMLGMQIGMVYERMKRI